MAAGKEIAGSIIASGVAQSVLPANAYRKGLAVQNRSHAPMIMRGNGENPTASDGLEIPARTMLILPTVLVSQNAIFLYSDVAGSVFQVLEGIDDVWASAPGGLYALDGIGGSAFDPTQNLHLTGAVTIDNLTATTPPATDSSNKPATTGYVRNVLGWYTPEMFGAKGDGTTDDSAAFQLALTACGAGPVPLICVRPSYKLAISGQLNVPTGVSIIGLNPYAGTDVGNQTQFNFSGGGGFYAAQGVSLYALRLTGISTATVPLVECKGQIGIYNVRTEGSPSGIRASNKVVLGYSNVSAPNVQMAPSSGLTNGTYSKVPFTGGGSTAATVQVVVSNGAISSIAFDTAGIVSKADFMMGFAAGALYSGSPAVTNAGEALISPMGRSRFHELWMVGHTAVALEVRGALDFSHFNNVHVWTGVPSITAGSVAFLLGHLDGGTFTGCKVFAYDTGCQWDCPAKGNNSFASVLGMEMDYTNVGHLITGPMKIDFTGGYIQTIGKCFNITSPIGVFKISTNLLTNADHHIVANDFALLNITGCNFESPQSASLFNCVIQPSSASKGVVMIGGNTSDGNRPFATLSGAVVGEIAANQWYPAYTITSPGNGYVNTVNVTGSKLTVQPIRQGLFSGTTDANGRVTIPHNMGTPGPLTPRVDMNGSAGNAGWRGTVLGVDGTNVTVQGLTATGAALASGANVTMFYSF